VASQAILDRLQAALSEAPDGPSTLAVGAPTGGNEDAFGTSACAASPGGWHITMWLPPEAMTNGTNPLILLDELRELGSARIVALTDRLPKLEEMDARDCLLGWDIELTGEVSRDDIEDVFIFVMDDMEISIEPLEPVAGLPPADLSGNDEAPHGAKSPPPSPASGSAPAARSGSPVEGESVRVPAERLNVLMDRVGELVIVQSRLAQLANGGIRGPAGELVLRSISEEVERLASELRDTTMVLRMVPVSTLFSRFRRLVHDLARETGKTIDLITEGESTEIDKTVSERLADPIVHLIRNSCDHGLETPEERRAAGKSAAGTIRLAAMQAGGEVRITIRDDGRGINRERIREKAEASGLLSPGQALGDAELLQLIFHPGFSTAAQITSISGRGVGMDVVKRTIEDLRGTIDVVSDPGQGSVITLRIPLTLAIIEGLLVRVGSDMFVIPLDVVEECIELSLEDDLRSRGRSMVRLREHLVPFLRLRELFEMGTRPDPFQKIVIITTAGQRVGLVVDQIVGSHQTVIKSMSGVHRRIGSFSGATILGDGSVALILDAAQLVALGQEQQERERLHATG